MMTKPIPFVKYRFLMIGISIAALVGALTYTMFSGGFKFGIDFQPGISLTVKFNESISIDSLTQEALNRSLESSKFNFSVQTLGEVEKKTFVLRASSPGMEENLQLEMEGDALKALRISFGESSVEVVQSDYIGPSLSSELVFQTIGLTLVAMLLIFVYVLFRFKIGFAVGAIIALIHDTLFVLAFIGVTGMEFSMAVIAAILTIIGYSLNDTIVVYDRIRENAKLLKGTAFGPLIDISVTQSLSRTFLTGGTTLFASFALYFFTSGQVKDFALCLLVGISVGTFSSIYIASPILMFFAKDTEKIEQA